MMFWKKKKSVKPQEPEQVLPAKIKEYPPKIKLAWMKALEGNKDIASWLKDNDYEELLMCNQAIYLKDEARAWLMKNGFPHLMALINAAEGNEKAAQWLNKHGFEEYFHMAMAIESQPEGWDWIKSYSTEDVFLLTKAIKKIKDEIEESHNDIHRFSSD